MLDAKDDEIAKLKLHIVVLEQMLGYAIDASQEAQRQAGQEPVAWMAHYTNKSGLPCVYTSSSFSLAVENDAKGTPVPLYAAPLPAAQSARADFEAWFRENYHSRLDRKCANQTYNCPAAFAAWNTWKACAKLYAKPQPAVEPKICHWSDDEDGTYHTECGNLFQFTDGGPKENDAKFCCYCGGTLDSDLPTPATQGATQ